MMITEIQVAMAEIIWLGNQLLLKLLWFLEKRKRRWPALSWSRLSSNFVKYFENTVLIIYYPNVFSSISIQHQLTHWHQREFKIIIQFHFLYCPLSNIHSVTWCINTRMGDCRNHFLLIDCSVTGETLKCFSTNDSVAQQQWTQCDDRKGFRTCFTKYNMSEFNFHF